MRRMIRNTIAGFLCAVALTSCMGGGTIGTGISSMRSGAAHGPASVVFTLKGRVVDAKGRAQPGAVVTLTTSKGSLSRTANSAGEIELPVAMESGEALSFSVRTAGRQFVGTQQVSPAGETVVRRTLVVGGAEGVLIQE